MVELNIAQLRLETPGCAKSIHLNNAGSSLPPAPVVRAVLDYLNEEMIVGGYETAARHAEDIEGFYETTAHFLQAQSRNIAYANSATDAYNRALSAIPFERGDVLLTTDDDYVSNQIAFLFLQKRLGIRVLRAEKLPQGGVDPQSVKDLMNKYRPKLVAVTHVPTNSGLVQDVESIGQFCREQQIWYLVDACQSAGQMPLDVEKIGCDFLSATMRKWLRGPRGAGFLYASDRVLEASLETWLPDMAGGIWVEKDEYQLAPNAKRFEQWEKPYALLLGSKAAIKYAQNLGLPAIQNRVTTLAEYTRRLLAGLPGVRILDRGSRKCGIVTLYLEGRQPGEVLDKLRAANIHAGVGQRGNALIDFDEKGVAWGLRVSPHYYNTVGEIERLAEVLF